MSQVPFKEEYRRKELTDLDMAFVIYEDSRASQVTMAGSQITVNIFEPLKNLHAVSPILSSHPHREDMYVPHCKSWRLQFHPAGILESTAKVLLASYPTDRRQKKNTIGIHKDLLQIQQIWV